MNKKIIFFCIAFIFCGGLYAQAAKPLDKVVAIVNEDIITQSDLEQKMTAIREQLRNNNSPQPSELELKQQVLSHLINLQIQLQLAKQSGVEVADQEVDEYIAHVAKTNNMSLTQFKREIASVGIPFSQYEENLKKEMIIARLQQAAIGEKVIVTDKDVDTFLKNNPSELAGDQEFRVKNILIPLSSSPGPEEEQAAQQKVKQILEKLSAGASFDTLAASKSDGKTTLQAGDLGWRKLADLPDIFAKKVVDMQKNTVAGPIRAGNGLHIIKLVDVRGGEQKHFVDLTHVRHILLKQDTTELDEEVSLRAQQVKQRIEKGEDFAAVAKEVSLDPLSAEKGGDLGWVAPGKLLPEFEQVMNQLKPGELSEPVKTQFGYHLIEVMDRKQIDDTENFQKTQVRAELYQRKFANEANNWIMQIRQSASIQIVDGDLVGA